MLDVFTKGLRAMIRPIQDLKPPLVAETLSRLLDFMTRDDPTQEDGTQDDLGHEDAAQPAGAAVAAGPQQESQGRRRRKMDTVKEEQSASLLSDITNVKEKIQTLVKYRCKVEDMGVHLDELVDVFLAMVKLTQQARGGLTLEAEKVTKASSAGEHISEGMDKILLKLSAATTPEQIAEAVDQGDSQAEAAEDWMKQCGLAHPNVSTIHLAVKVRHQVWLCSSGGGSVLRLCLGGTGCNLNYM